MLLAEKFDKAGLKKKIVSDGKLKDAKQQLQVEALGGKLASILIKLKSS